MSSDNILEKFVMTATRAEPDSLLAMVFVVGPIYGVLIGAVFHLVLL